MNRLNSICEPYHPNQMKEHDETTSEQGIVSAQVSPLTPNIGH